jgi:small subunit ribosomal protein S3
MGQKVSPIGFRTGITLGWQSTWFAPKASYGDCLVEDQKIRGYVDKRFNQRMPKGAVARVEIIRTRNEVNVTLHSGRPGVVIGPRGGEVDRVREELERLVGRKVTVNVVEIKDPELCAALVAQGVAEQLGKRASFRRTMKQQCEGAMNAGAKGIKIQCSGRLAGSEMARRETQKLGSIPLHTLDANVDYAITTARTTYGAIGVKVWIYKGKFGEEIQPIRRPAARRRPPRGAPGRRPGAPTSGRSTERTPAAAPAPVPAPAPPTGEDKTPKPEAGPSAEG